MKIRIPGRGGVIFTAVTWFLALLLLACIIFLMSVPYLHNKQVTYTCYKGDKKAPIHDEGMETYHAVPSREPGTSCFRIEQLTE